MLNSLALNTRSGHLCLPSAETKGTCHHTWIITRIKKMTIYFRPSMWDQRTTRWRHFFPSTVGSWVELPSSGLATASLSSCWLTPGLYYCLIPPPFYDQCGRVPEGSCVLYFCFYKGAGHQSQFFGVHSKGLSLLSYPASLWVIWIRILLSSRSFSNINYVCRRQHMMCALRC